MSKSKLQMSNEIQSSNNQKVYDLEERTAKFGEDVIRFARKIPKDTVTIPIRRIIVKLMEQKVKRISSIK